MRDEIARLTAAGKTRDEVVQYFIAKYGSQEVLSEPIDQGFNRLAWLFPYVTGLAGVLVLGAVAIRWSRRPHAAAPAQEPGTPVNAALEEQLEDELRNLD
jgi:cytochrome c-type biogenesis protein CcmH/NrfF